MIASERRGRIFLWAAIFLAVAATRRTMHSGGHFYDISLWAIELAVLLLILYEVLVGIAERHKARARSRFLEIKRAIVSDLIDKGRKLRYSTPHEGDPELHEWLTSVNAWEVETLAELRKCSERAAAAFSLAQSIGITDNTVYLPNRHFHEFYISGNLRVAYQRLATRLSALNAIMEKADVYF